MPSKPTCSCITGKGFGVAEFQLIGRFAPSQQHQLSWHSHNIYWATSTVFTELTLHLTLRRLHLCRTRSWCLQVIQPILMGTEKLPTQHLNWRSREHQDRPQLGGDPA